MEDLNAIALRYQTDKSSQHHNYSPAYERITHGMRDKVKGLLEIGILLSPDPATSAKSLKMWAEYFPNAKVVGIDIDERYQHDFGPRISCVFGDSSRKSVLDKAVSLMPEVNIIIDDASHVFRYAFATFEYLFTKLAPGGGLLHRGCAAWQG